MKYIPDEKQIEELLENSSPKPGPRLDQRLSAAPWTPRGVAHRRIVSATIFAILALALLVTTTPQGRAFAQSFLQFFVPAQATSFPLPPLLMSPN